MKNDYAIPNGTIAYERQYKRQLITDFILSLGLLLIAVGVGWAIAKILILI